nr:hypothetical protein [uncultured Roseibium sp.]
MEHGFDLSAIISIAKRRYLYFLIPAILVFSMVTAFAFTLPRSFEAKATILIESQRIPTELASTTVTASPRERIKVIEQRLLARDNLLSIANEFSLYQTNKAGTLSPTEVVEEMREAISIEQIAIASSGRNTQVIGFDVSFQYTSAITAARVANELVTSILSQNLETRLRRAAETSNFFQQQLQQLESDLVLLERKMAEYKRDNENALPETLAMRREDLSEIAEQIDSLDQQIRLSQNSGLSTGTATDAEAKQLVYRLQSRELDFDSFVERRELLGPLLEKGFVSQRTMDDLDRQIAQVEIDIAAIKSQMEQEGFTADPEARENLLLAEKASLQRKANELRESIAKTPVIEVELSAMVRDYENLQYEFNQTKLKLTDAEIGERLEEDRQAERFEVLEQATVPEEATKPNRTQIVAAGGGGAIAIGAALVLLLEFFDNSIRTAGDLERRLKVRPIAVIPYVTTRRERIRRISRRILTVCLFLLGIMGVLAVVHQYVQPIDLLAERVWHIVEPFMAQFNLL